MTRGPIRTLIQHRLGVGLAATAMVALALPAMSVGPAMAANPGQVVLCSGKAINPPTGCTGSDGPQSTVLLRTNPTNMDGNISFNVLGRIGTTVPDPFSGPLNGMFHGDEEVIIDVSNPTGCYDWNGGLDDFFAPLVPATTCDGSGVGTKWIKVPQGNYFNLLNIRATIESGSASYMSWSGGTQPIELAIGTEGDLTAFNFCTLNSSSNPVNCGSTP